MLNDRDAIRAVQCDQTTYHECADRLILKSQIRLSRVSGIRPRIEHLLVDNSEVLKNPVCVKRVICRVQYDVSCFTNLTKLDIWVEDFNQLVDKLPYKLQNLRIQFD